MSWWQRLTRRFRRPPPFVEPAEGWFSRWLAETRFLHRYPHHAGLLCRFDVIETRAVDTMAVALRRWDEPNGRLQLLINREALEPQRSFLAGILLHELAHVTLGHLSDERLHVVARPLLMELAMEMSANEDLIEPLPPSVQWQAFREHGVGPRQSTLERYLLLCRAADEGRLSELDLWTSRILDVHRPHRASSGLSAGVGDLLDARSDGATSRNWSMGLGPPTHPLKLAQMRRLLREHLGDAEGGGAHDVDPTRPRAGKELDRVLAPSRRDGTLDWRRLVHEAFERQRRVRPDYLRPNRRHPARVGEVPGRSRRRPKQRLLVAIDTSGSMSVTALERVASEVERLGRVALVTVVECDAALHRLYPLRGALGPFVGGGDTDFRPVLEAPEAARFDGLVYFTDGHAPPPANPRRVPTLWVLTGDRPRAPAFGHVVRLPV